MNTKMDTKIHSTHAYMLMLTSWPSSLAHKLLMLMLVLMLASLFLTNPIKNFLHHILPCCFLLMFIFEVFWRFLMKDWKFSDRFCQFFINHCFACHFVCQWERSGTQCSLIGQQSYAYAYAYAKPVLTGNNSDISTSISIRRTQGFNILSCLFHGRLH